MRLYKEVYRDDHWTNIKETFYNDKKQAIAFLETNKTADGTNGSLTVYEYTGDNYRTVGYSDKTKSYEAFINKGHAILGTSGWHSPKESHVTRERKFEKGLLVSEDYHDSQYDVRFSVRNTYKDGLLVSETTTRDNGVVERTEYLYQNGLIQSKNSFFNNEFQEQIIYLYGNDQVLIEEQIFNKHKDTQYLAENKKFHYNAKREREKTEYYGRYDSRLVLYSVEEEVREGNQLTKKSASKSTLEGMVGYYDLAALHQHLKESNMDWAIPTYGKNYADTAAFDVKIGSIKKYDGNGNVIETQEIDPDTRQVYAQAVYRNEYNEKQQLEFTIAYRALGEGKTEEANIKKFYYLD